MLETGIPAPDFALSADDGNEVRLSDFRGRRVVLYFYPRANTSGCTRQAVALRDVYPKLEEAGVVAIGVSPDSPRTLARFREKYNLPFVLLSDPEHRVAEEYGAWGRKARGRMGIIRSHFAIDEEGKLVEVAYKVKPEETARMALEFASKGNLTRGE